MKSVLPLIAGMLYLLTGCSPAPQAVNFGLDMCAHCKMTIVDVPFCAEVVSQKGKAFKFDAIECMVHYLERNNETDFALFLVRDYNAPEEWQNARQASFLISEQLPSPMGAFLSAYHNRDDAVKMQQEKGGNVYSWEELKKQISRN